MKKFSLIVAGLVFAGNIMAAEYKGNPDRFPSIGFYYEGFSLEGDAEIFGGGASAPQDIENSGGTFFADLRIPVSDGATFLAGVGIQNVSSEAKETPLLFGSSSDAAGFRFGVGMRFYLKGSGPEKSSAPQVSRKRVNSESVYLQYVSETQKYNAFAKARGDKEIEILDFEDWAFERDELRSQEEFRRNR